MHCRYYGDVRIFSLLNMLTSAHLVNTTEKIIGRTRQGIQYEGKTGRIGHG
jgi:hypothetical protein